MQYSASEASNSLNQRWVAQLASLRKARELNAQGSGSQKEEELVQLRKSTPCRPQHTCNLSEGTWVAADHELQTKKLKKVRLLKKNERKEVRCSVSEEEVLTYVMDTVPPKLVSSLFADGLEFWNGSM